MVSSEERLSDFIDRLNEERKPAENEYTTESEELKDLFSAVKLVRTLKEPAMPEAGFERRLIGYVTEKLAPKSRKNKKSRMRMAVLAAAAALLCLTAGILFPFKEKNMVSAMAEAYQDVKAYRGILEIKSANSAGETVTQAKLEVWADKKGRYYVKGLEGANANIITVNNGKRKWQIRPDQKRIYLFSPFPDSYRFIFEIGKEIDEAENALDVRRAGEAKIHGRTAEVLEVTPRSGLPYKIWVDKKTKLPVQKETAAQNAVRYTVTYAELDFYDAIPEDLLAYQAPAAYEAVDEDAELAVNDWKEAASVAGFAPPLPGALPEGFMQEGIAVVPERKLLKIYYAKDGKKAAFIQGKAERKFTPSPSAMLGEVDGSVAEIQSPLYEAEGILSGGNVYAGNTDLRSIRWQKDGFEYAVIGNVSLEDLGTLTEAVTGWKFFMPAAEGKTWEPQVKVPYDLKIEENTQKGVDAGSMPWKLDPVYTAQVFVNLEISPEGISGDGPIGIEDFKMIHNDGKLAVVSVLSDKSPIEKVYLKRLVRQDPTGIWTVVGYDPAGKN